MNPLFDDFVSASDQRKKLSELDDSRLQDFLEVLKTTIVNGLVIMRCRHGIIVQTPWSDDNGFDSKRL